MSCQCLQAEAGQLAIEEPRPRGLQREEVNGMFYAVARGAWGFTAGLWPCDDHSLCLLIKIVAVKEQNALLGGDLLDNSSLGDKVRPLQTLQKPMQFLHGWTSQSGKIKSLSSGNITPLFTMPFVIFSPSYVHRRDSRSLCVGVGRDQWPFHIRSLNLWKQRKNACSRRAKRMPSSRAKMASLHPMQQKDVRMISNTTGSGWLPFAKSPILHNKRLGWSRFFFG